MVIQCTAITALKNVGYVQDRAGYPFRYSRMTEGGVRIIDLLVDDDAPDDHGALRVPGLASAATRTEDVALEIAAAGTVNFRVPSLDGAFLLRALALSGGPGDLKFEDYANDAGVLALLLAVSSESLAHGRMRDGAALTSGSRAPRGATR